MNKDTTPHGEETNRAQNKYRRRVKRVPERIYEHIKGAPTKAQPAAKTIGDRLSSAAAEGEGASDEAGPAAPAARWDERGGVDDDEHLAAYNAFLARLNDAESGRNP